MAVISHLFLSLTHSPEAFWDCGCDHLHGRLVLSGFKYSITADIMRGSPAKIPIGAGPSNIKDPVLVAQTANGSVAAALNAP